MKPLLNKFYTFAKTTLMLVFVSVSHSAFAHLMVAQHGTLNIVDDGAYVIISFPVSAFDDLDTDDDGKISMQEFNNKRRPITESIRSNLQLIDGDEDAELKGLMLSPETVHDASPDDISQITVMGKFVLSNTKSELKLTIGLYSAIEAKQTMKIKVTRKADNLEKAIELTPNKPSAQLLAELKLS